MTSSKTLQKPTPMPSSRYWLFVSALLLALPILLYWATAWSMVEIWWRSDTFAHGFLILPIALYLIWKKRLLLAQQPVNTNGYGIVLLALSGLFWFFSNLVDIAVIQQLMFVSLIPGLVLTLFGWSITRVIFFPLCFLFFMVPFGERLIPSLIEFTAFFTIRSVQLTGIPIYWEGNNLSLPSGNWSVVEACSGIRYLIASIALGSLYCYITFKSMMKRSVFFGLFIIVPIIANGMRAFMIVMIGHFSSMKLATGVDHLVYGWVFFGFVMFIMFYLGSFWADDFSDEAAEQNNSDETTAEKAASVSSRYRVSIPVIVVATALISLYPFLAYQNQVAPNAPQATPMFTELPAQLGPWQLDNSSITDWRPAYKGAEVELHAVYRNGERRVGLLLEHYPQQVQGNELVSSQNVLVERSSKWRQTESGAVTLPNVDGLASVKQARLKSPTKHIVVWHWYFIAGKHTINDYLAKAYNAYGKLLKGDESATGVILYIEDDEAIDQQQTMSSFSALLLPWLNDS